MIIRDFTVFAATVAVTTCGFVSSQDWYREHPTSSPAARRFHGMDFDAARGVTVLFGGTDERNGIVFGDTWEYDGAEWALRTQAGPAPRERFASCFDPSRGAFLVFGGRDAQGVLLDDLWAWDGSAWTRIAHQPAPSARMDATMAFDEVHQRVVLFGGRGHDAQQPFGDTWELDGNGWTESAPATSPGPRFGHAMTCDPNRGVAIVFGGFVGGASGTSVDTWEYDGATWREVVTATVPPVAIFPAMTFHRGHGVAVLTGATGSFTPAVQTFAFDGVDWHRGPTAPRELAGRQGHGLAYDAARDAAVLFGGARITFAGAQPLDETWELSTEARSEAFGHGCATSVGMLGLAPVGDARPEIGTAFPLECGPLPSGAAPWLLIGLSDKSWGGAALPLELTPFGLPGCGLFVRIDAVWPMTTAAKSGRASLPLPLDAGLVGAQLFVQGLVTGQATSNAVRLTLGN